MNSRKARAEKRVIKLLEEVEGLCRKNPYLWNLVGWEIFMRKGGNEKGMERVNIYGEFFEDYLKRLSPGARVLDLGCGTGRFTAYLLERGFDVHSVDVSSTALSKVRGSKRYLLSAEDLSSLNGKNYVAVFAIELLNYVSAPGRVLEGIKGVLGKKGILFISVENKYGGILSSSLLRIRDVIDALEGGEAVLKWEMATRYFTEGEFKVLLKKHGFRILKFGRLHYVWDGVFQHLLDNPFSAEEAHKLEVLSRKDRILKHLARAWAAVAVPQ